VHGICWYWYATVFLLLLGGLILVFAVTGAPFVALITVDWNTAHQTIDGFGAAINSDMGTLPSKLMDFFYTDSGAHLIFIRVHLYPDLADCEADDPAASCVSSANATISKSELANVQAAVARGALVWAAEWSPPGSMKSNGQFLGSGSFLGGTTNMTNLAAIQASFVTLLTGIYNIPIYAISPQNEPYVSQKYASCTWTAQQIHDYVPYLVTALTKAGYGSTRIMIAEQVTWSNSVSTTAMNDGTVAPMIGILASHGYGGSATPLRWNNFTTQRVWETEVSDFAAYDGSITSGLTYATKIHNWLTAAQVNAWHYWLLSGAAVTDNSGLTDHSNNLAKRAYTFANFSKFVRPGWQRMDVRNSGSLLVSAFRGPESKFAIVAINNSRWAARNQTFALNGVTSQRSRVTPWLTSASASLELQSPVSFTARGTILTYTIPAKSVVTFQGQAD
jgi:glucuronoarabinoxylan endo-1,4-beta-xylanase